VPAPAAIPCSQIDTLFLDVGNTLISIDFDWVSNELAARGIAASAETLRRAEAAARPKYSQQLFVDGLAPGTDTFFAYLLSMLNRLESLADVDGGAREQLATELKQVLRPTGRASVLWRSVMPRVPEAMGRLRDCGLSLVVVSNSDGTVEQSLQTAGLRPYLSLVVDSAIVGFEKPDPRIFQYALEEIGARPERTLHVGDIYHADVEGARGAGIHALLLDPYGDWSLDGCVRAPDLWAVADLFDRQ
jgi:HAD superfamily hydrolase (TIGR01509 family)